MLKEERLSTFRYKLSRCGIPPFLHLLIFCVIERGVAFCGMAVWRGYTAVFVVSTKEKQGIITISKV